jgi:hypothetical protein
MRTPSLLLLAGALALTTACPTTDDEGESDTVATGTENGDGDGDGDTGECTTPPAGVFGNCIAGGPAACEAEGSTVCPTDNLDNPSLGVCAKRCDDICDCWAAPATGDAAVSCVALVNGDPTKTCVLDCSSGETCPTGMECLDSLSICVWPAG